jgi:cellobiose-specific phosphotransferase system component IIC
VHASLYTSYALVLACKLGPLDSDFVSLLFFILLIELVLLGMVMQQTQEAAREINGAPWLFSALTIAMLAGAACGALAWRLAVRADIVHVAPVTWRVYQQ